MLALGEAVFGAVFDNTPPGSAGARWLLHVLPGARPTLRGDDADPGSGSLAGWAFPDGGYLLFGSRFGEPGEIKGMLDCGLLGYLGIAAPTR